MSQRKGFDSELGDLNNSLMIMCGQIECMYDNLFQSYKKKEKESINVIIKNERVIKDMERKIESKCLLLITRQQPVANDLRNVSAALKVVTDLQRSGEHVIDMAELLLRMELQDMSGYTKKLEAMIVATRKMIRNAVDAFIDRDTQLAARNIEADDEVDEMFNAVKLELIHALKEENADPDMCVDILMVAKYLEKIADHAVNISEWTIFEKTGEYENIQVY